jgi:hypothetical protein
VLSDKHERRRHRRWHGCRPRRHDDYDQNDDDDNDDDTGVSVEHDHHAELELVRPVGHDLPDGLVHEGG